MTPAQRDVAWKLQSLMLMGLPAPLPAAKPIDSKGAISWASPAYKVVGEAQGQGQYVEAARVKQWLELGSPGA